MTIVLIWWDLKDGKNEMKWTIKKRVQKFIRLERGFKPEYKPATLTRYR